MEIHFSRNCDVTRAKNFTLFEIARVLVRFNHGASFIINPAEVSDFSRIYRPQFPTTDKAGARTSNPSTSFRRKREKGQKLQFSMYARPRYFEVFPLVEGSGESK
jgi:hypothetical protein